jgi:hypothetical protein
VLRALLFAAALGAATLALAAAERGPDAAALYAPHRADGAFFNPWEPFEFSVGRFLRWKLGGNPYDKSAEPAIPRVANDGASLAGLQHSSALTWVGHATVAVHDDDDVFLTDPHWSERALVPRRVAPPGIPHESVPADAVAVI